MEPIVTKARAKLNLTLDVLGKRSDGYHDLCMVMQSVALCDTVTIRREAERGMGGTLERECRMVRRLGRQCRTVRRPGREFRMVRLPGREFRPAVHPPPA